MFASYSSELSCSTHVLHGVFSPLGTGRRDRYYIFLTNNMLMCLRPEIKCIELMLVVSSWVSSQTLVCSQHQLDQKTRIHQRALEIKYVIKFSEFISFPWIVQVAIR